MKTPSPASRLLQVCGRLLNDVCTHFFWSWLASEGALKPCRANENAFAGKPAPTGLGSLAE
jgi:hypothetical protein